MTTNTTEKTPAQLNAEWLDAVNQDAEAKAKELSALFKCIVEPMVFVITPGKDAAVGYFKKPNAKTAYEMLLNGRKLGVAAASDLIARAQMIREADIKPFNPSAEMKASDPRFMDVDGNYLPENTDINTGLLYEIFDLINPVSNVFKKK